MSHLENFNKNSKTFSGVLIPARAVPRVESRFKLFTDSGDWLDLEVSDKINDFLQQHLWMRFTFFGDMHKDGRLKVNRVMLEKDSSGGPKFSVTA